MKKFIFITEEGNTLAPNNIYEINNMQVIGIVDKVASEDEALAKLLYENQWITDSGFNIDNLITYEIK